MSRKKAGTVALSPEETTQVQDLFAQYHQLAQQLRASSQQAGAESALAPLQALPAEAQLAFLTTLAKENHVDAADLLVAVNTFHPDKETRKEARRALLRLESDKITPQWVPPVVHTSAITVKVANPPRFWKGWATQTREEGEITLTLCWEQGYDYSEGRMLSFQLDFWEDGIKNCMVRSDSRRRVDGFQADMRSSLGAIPVVECTPAEGKRLIEEALTVNEWRQSTPQQDYYHNLPLITKLLQLEDNPDTDTGRTFINPELEPQEVAINYIGAWAMGDYGLAYDLLSDNSAIRAGVARDEWISLRRAWADEAHPARLELGFVHERAANQSAIWLPNTSSSRATRHEIELGWSLELTDTQLSGTLKEMPMGTAVNKDTGRHWFWTSYTIVRERNTWRIQNIVDEGAKAQGLSITELQRRVKEHIDAIDALLKEEQQKADPQKFAEEVSWRLTQMLHYYDALLVLLPLDYQTNQDAYQRSVVAANPERTTIYLERLAQRFPNNHAETLRRLGSTLTTLAYKYEDPELQERQQQILARAEKALQDALEDDHSALGYVLLAELYLSQGRNDDAEAQLTKAKAGAPSPDEEATIEAGLGNIAMRLEQIPEAIPHFERAAEINAEYPGIWFSLGFANRLLGKLSQAEIYYQRAVANAPDDERSFSELIAIAMNRGDKAKAQQIAEQAVQSNPASASLHALLASVLQEMGNARAAQQQLAQAEAIDPELDIVQSVRQHLTTVKKKERA
ncbi:MAG TPA: tetratricopeptide repeat protein [Ktedonobacteraceae bacterium]|nr:tetratricopeptide repeat protein [Ktedonobacteraceae bacterium]